MNDIIIKTFKAAQDNIEHKNVIIKLIDSIRIVLNSMGLILCWMKS